MKHVVGIHFACTAVRESSTATLLLDATVPIRTSESAVGQGWVGKGKTGGITGWGRNGAGRWHEGVNLLAMLMPDHIHLQWNSPPLFSPQTYDTKSGPRRPIGDPRAYQDTSTDVLYLPLNCPWVVSPLDAEHTFLGWLHWQKAKDSALSLPVIAAPMTSKLPHQPSNLLAYVQPNKPQIPYLVAVSAVLLWRFWGHFFSLSPLSFSFLFSYYFISFV